MVIRLGPNLMSSARSVNLNKAIVLVILMITMTQVGYLDLINSPKTGNDSFDEESSVMETGGSSNSPTTQIRHSYQLSTRGLHSCSILDNGSLMCWGLNNRGQVGDGTTTDAHTPPKKYISNISARHVDTIWMMLLPRTIIEYTSQ